MARPLAAAIPFTTVLLCLISSSHNALGVDGEWPTAHDDSENRSVAAVNSDRQLPPQEYRLDPSSVGVDRRRSSLGGWYGAPILWSDLAALALASTALLFTSSESTSGLVGPTLAGAGIVYVVDGPIVHFMNDRVDTGGVSLALRIGAPIGAGIVGLFAATTVSRGCTGEMCGLGVIAEGAALGFGAGILVASVIDITVLARAEPSDSKRHAVAVMPSLDPRQRSAGLSLAGTW